MVKTKIILLLAVLLSLAACDPNEMDCTYVQDNELKVSLYRECLLLLSQSRSGQSYTTNDDEDYDEAIRECGQQAYKISTKKICTKETK